MLSKKNVLGIAIGLVGIILGTFFLIQDLMSNVHDVNDVVDTGKSDIFSFDALQHYHEFLNVTGNSFHVILKSPQDGLQVNHDFTNIVNFDWFSLHNGKHFINITNTGDSVLHVTGKLQAVTNPMIFT
ncbi:MAG: hypothetical protein P4K92_04210, partial [Candidatus Nitrosotalea sp.]|nr:hypothetical protein [Candidatus Nitrosotalea sp.]